MNNLRLAKKNIYNNNNKVKEKHSAHIYEYELNQNNFILCRDLQHLQLVKSYLGQCFADNSY